MSASGSLFGPPEWFLLARRRPGTAAAIAPGAGVAAGPARQEERRSVVAGRGAETAARAREFDGESPRASRRSHRRGGSTHRGRFVDRRRGYGFTPNAIDDLALRQKPDAVRRKTKGLYNVDHLEERDRAAPREGWRHLQSRVASSVARRRTGRGDAAASQRRRGHGGSAIVGGCGPRSGPATSSSPRRSATGAPKFLVGLLAGLAIGALLGAKAGQHQARTEPTGLVTGDDCSKAKEGSMERVQTLHQKI